LRHSFPSSCGSKELSSRRTSSSTLLNHVFFHVSHINVLP
jgi:hypothetical protein